MKQRMNLKPQSGITYLAIAFECNSVGAQHKTAVGGPTPTVIFY